MHIHALLFRIAYPVHSELINFLLRMIDRLVYAFKDPLDDLAGRSRSRVGSYLTALTHFLYIA